MNNPLIKLVKTTFSTISINGNEELFFEQNSNKLIEDLLDIYFEKNDYRYLKTIIGYIKKLDFIVYLKKVSWKTFQVRTKNDILMELSLPTKKHISENIKSTNKQESDRLYKIMDIKEIIEYILENTENTKLIKNDNFSILDWMYEHKLSAPKLLRLRILQTVTYCKRNKIHSIHDNEDVKSYIKSFMDTSFQKCLKNNKNLDFIMYLQLYLYISVNDYAQFKFYLHNVKQRLNGIANKTENSIPPYVLMDKLYREYLKINDCLFTYIDKQIQGR